MSINHLAEIGDAELTWSDLEDTESKPVTYDHRLADAARQVGFRDVAPGQLN